MSALPRWLSRLPVVRRWDPESQARLVEVTRFCLVGGANWLVDFAIFNAARWALPTSLVLVAKVIAVAVAATFSWIFNRNWTFRDRATKNPGREWVTFLIVNAVGLLPPLLCLWFTHFVLGWTSLTADNISANVVGLILGTVLRYFGYRYLVFTRR